MSFIIPTNARQIYSVESAMLTVVAEGSTCACVMSQKDGRVYLQKSLKDEFKNDADLRSAMRKEWEVGQSLSSPYFVKYYELVDEDGIPSLLMDFVDGSTVRELLDGDQSWFSARENLQKFFLQLLEGLKYLHQQQIVHLDLSPTNLMVTNINQDVRIIDLGFCYSPSHLSVIGGTHEYSAPELYDKTMRIDARADIYSVGRIIVEIIEAAYPQSQSEVSDIKQVALKCCRQNREERYQSADDVISAFAQSKPQSAKRKWLVWVFVAMVAVVATMCAWLQFCSGGADADGVVNMADSAVVVVQDTIAAPIVADNTANTADSAQTAIDVKVDTIVPKTNNEPDNVGTHQKIFSSPVILDPGYSLGGYVNSTDDKSSIPFTITLKNKLGINSYQVDVILPNEECVFIRQPDPNSRFLKYEQFRLPNPSLGKVGYSYNEAFKSYLIVHTLFSIDEEFVGTSGKILTIYFDGSSLPDGSYYIIMHSGLMYHIVDHQTVEHYGCGQKLIYFTIDQGKVTPGRKKSQ